MGSANRWNKRTRTSLPKARTTAFGIETVALIINYGSYYSKKRTIQITYTFSKNVLNIGKVTNATAFYTRLISRKLAS